ncbi:MAG: DUF2312 domain-containing protein [Vicinamibacteria bacterium]|nr:DUF2312 domain-containing protein [Vicinamibacteria bacterium]
MNHGTTSVRNRLVHHVHQLERLETAKQAAAADFREALNVAQADGFDGDTLKAILKLRKMTPAQRKERRAIEAIYLASLGMLDGDPLPDEARRRLAPPPPEPEAPSGGDDHGGESARSPAPAEPPPPVAPPQQAQMLQKDPAEAREEGRAAAAAGKKVYENPYPAGDPCRAAWDEGWCESSGSHGMDIPSAFQRRKEKKPPKGDSAKGDDGDDDSGREE